MNKQEAREMLEEFSEAVRKNPHAYEWPITHPDKLKALLGLSKRND